MHSSFPKTFIPKPQKIENSDPKDIEQYIKYEKNNVVALTMDVLEFEENVITGAPVNCQQCKAFLSITSKDFITKQDK